LEVFVTLHLILTILLTLGAYMEETDVWGTLTTKNSVIFHDNDVSLQKEMICYRFYSVSVNLSSFYQTYTYTCISFQIIQIV